MISTVHVIGAGVAGLACAVRLARLGRRVVVHEAAGQAGGRCRSFVDETLERTIDNGNHLLLSGNRSAMAYLDEIGAADTLVGPPRAAYPFLDLENGRRWTVRPNAGPVPWWVFAESRRVPDTGPWDYAKGLRLAWAGADETVGACLDDQGPLFRRFWEPMAVASLNTSAQEGAASLLWPVVRDTFGRGEALCRPLIAGAGLSESFVYPALRTLEASKCALHLNQRLRALSFDGGRVAALEFGRDRVSLAPDDDVVLTAPPAVSAGLVPDLVAPRESRAIVNGHFRLDGDARDVSLLGLVGGTCHWLFLRGTVASVTVSAADSLADDPSDAIAERMWRDIVGALEVGSAPLPPYRIVKEKRATFAQTPGDAARRPRMRTRWSNLFLAGDWTDTGLPATIEGAVRSGHAAAAAVASSSGT